MPNASGAGVSDRTMQSPSDRLKQARIRRGFESAADAARALQMSEPTVRAHENGTRKLRWDVAQRYARAYGVDATWLMDGDRKPSSKAGLENPVTPKLANVYGVVAAGLWFEDDGWQTPKFEDVPVVPMKYRGVQQTAWKVIGPSMDLVGIIDGGFVVTVPYWEVRVAPQDNDLVVVEQRDGSKIERSVKQVLILPETIELWPRSSSPEFQRPIVIPRDHSADSSAVELIGLVVGFYRAFSF